MARTTVTAGDRLYAVSSDDPVRGHGRWALIRARATDELTGEGPRVPIALDVRTADVFSRVGPDGIVGIVTAPWTRFPSVFSATARVDVTVRAQGFVPLELRVPVARSLTAAAAAGASVLALDTRTGMRPGQAWTIGVPAGPREPITIAALGPGPGQVTLASPIATMFAIGAPLVPDPLTTLDLGDLPLRREATVVQGRVLRFNAVTREWNPIAATVRVTFVWRRLEDTPIEAAKVPATMADVVPGLSLRRPALVSTVMPVTIAPVAGSARTLDGDVDAGARALRLTTADGLAAGGALRLEGDVDGRTELVTLAAVTPIGGTADPADVTLIHPVRLPHRRGAAVERITVTPAPPAATVDDEAERGDRTLFLDALPWAAAPAAVRITGGGLPELRLLRLYEVSAGSDGYFSLPPVSRVAKLRLEVTAPPSPAQDVDVMPDYGSDTNWMDVRFP